MTYIVHRICHALLFVGAAFSPMFVLLNTYICSYEGKQMAEAEMNANVTNEQMENDEKKTGEKKERTRVVFEIWKHFTRILNGDPDHPRAKCSYYGATPGLVLLGIIMKCYAPKIQIG